MTLADELQALCRSLWRMRAEFGNSAAWVHVVGACKELQRAIALLKRGPKT